MRAAAAIAALLAVLVLGACGDGGGETTALSSTADDSAQSQNSATGSAQFEVNGGDNSIQEFGSEASGEDFAAAATALHGYLDARAAGAWRDACSYMAGGVTASLAQLSGGQEGQVSCPEVLASLSAGISAASLREAAEAKVGALRLEGGRAFLLFRGARETVYFMPMAEESGAWKVVALAPSALP